MGFITNQHIRKSVMSIFHLRLFSKNGVSKLDFDLPDIFKVIVDIQQTNWLLRLSYNDDIALKSSMELYEFLNTIGAKDLKNNYYLLDTETLQKLLNEIFQTIFIVLIAVPFSFELRETDTVQVIDYGDTRSQIQLNDGSIEVRAIDSSYFEVLAKDENLLEKLVSHFANVEIIQ